MPDGALFVLVAVCPGFPQAGFRGGSVMVPLPTIVAWQATLVVSTLVIDVLSMLNPTLWSMKTTCPATVPSV